MIEITAEEAIARLADDAKVEVRFECVPNTGETHVAHLERHSILADALNGKHPVFESGPSAQSINFGVYIQFQHKVHGPGLLFMSTKPECQLSEAQLDESLERGYGADLFSRV